MLFLVTDTSGKHGSVALVRAEASRKPELIEAVPLEGGTFSAQLVPQIAALLAEHGYKKTDIDAFIAISGPGSFTGLRVGLAAIKALAEILEKSIVPVSLLEVIAVASGASGRVIAAIDAGRGEVYAGEYEVAGTPRMVREQLLTREELFSAALNQTIASCDESLAKAVQQAGIAVVQIAPPDALMIATVGAQRLQAGQVVSPEQLDANYIRRSDAEIFAKNIS